VSVEGRRETKLIRGIADGEEGGAIVVLGDGVDRTLDEDECALGDFASGDQRDTRRKAVGV